MHRDTTSNIGLATQLPTWQECLDFLQDPRAGALTVFSGNVRNHSHQRNVMWLDFEAYEPMALREMNAIANEAADQWPLYRVFLWHRLGRIYPGEIAVMVAVCAAHRDAAYMANRHIIDTLKERVPIWKKEYFEDGAVWVNATP